MSHREHCEFAVRSLAKVAAEPNKEESRSADGPACVGGNVGLRTARDGDLSVVEQLAARNRSDQAASVARRSSFDVPRPWLPTAATSIRRRK